MPRLPLFFPRAISWKRYARRLFLVAFLASASTAAGASSASAALPADTTSGIHLALPFNRNEPIVGGTMQGEAGVVDYVWGALGDPGNIPGGSTWHETYIPWGRDPQFEPLSWFIANHPTWVMYTVDRQTPATLPGDSSPILDTTNPDVQAWYESQAETLLSSGFNGISWDNGIVYNEAHAVGHYGASGQWVQQYSGASQDSSYANAQTSAFSAVVSAIRSAYPQSSDTLNQPFSCDAIWSQPLTSIDMLLDEESFTNYGDAAHPYVTTAAGDGCSNDWLARTQEYVTLQKTLGKGLTLLNEEPYTVTPYMTGSNLTARADLQWALANYLLVKYSHTYFWWGGVQQYGGGPLMQQEYQAPVGSPVDDMHAAQGVYVRDYTGGAAIVNPDPSRTITVTLTGTFHDLYGNAVTSLVMGPHSGDVILGSSGSAVSTSGGTTGGGTTGGGTTGGGTTGGGTKRGGKGGGTKASGTSAGTAAGTGSGQSIPRATTASAAHTSRSRRHHHRRSHHRGRRHHQRGRRHHHLIHRHHHRRSSPRQAGRFSPMETLHLVALLFRAFL